MKKSFFYSILALGTASIITGCGGGGGGSDVTNTALNTGTGYYLDSAVAGAEYKCGTQTGVTGKDGNFTFEKGADCSFELAGVPLRSIKATELKDGVKIVEDNLTVARFLQSLDFDGNPDNGIQIEKKVLEALKEAVKNLTNKKEALDKELDAVVAEVETKVDEFKGRVVSEDEAFEHLSKTLSPTIKELLAGKTYYAAEDWESDGIVEFEVRFSKDLTTIDIKVIKSVKPNIHGGNESIKVEGNKITWLSDNSYDLIYKKDGYLLFVSYDKNGKRTEQTKVYFNKADADKEYEKMTK
jgi:hypothetical protein